MQLPLLHHVHGLNSGDQFLSTPKRLVAHHWVCDSLHGSVVLLHDVVEVLLLAQFDVPAGVGIHATNGRGVGATFVDGDLLGQAMQIDGTL